MDWTAGYVSDVTYTFGYYPELNPLRIRYALLNAGIAAPTIKTACELAFGQGLSVNLHAAGSGVSWFGTDFNPAHAAFARDTAAASGASARLYDDSFADFAMRDDLPDFDLIVMHGTWSWISAENRAAVRDFIARKLKAGGVCFLSYNALPGWSSFAPVQHLMKRHVDQLGAEGGAITKRMDDAITFVHRLLETGPKFAGVSAGDKDAPHRDPFGVLERLKRLQKHDRHYLVHEYLHSDWTALYFHEVEQALADAKCSYACPASFTEGIDHLNLSPAQAQLIAEIPSASLRETVRDLMVGRQFRRDYFVKGLRKLSQAERAHALRQVRLVMCAPRSSFKLSIACDRGQARLSPEIYEPIMDVLADHLPRSIAELESQLRERAPTVTFPQLVEANAVLTGAGFLAPCALASDAAEASATANRLNAWISDRAKVSSDIRYLASPVTGGGVNTSQVDQIFLATLLDKAEVNGESLSRSSLSALGMPAEELAKAAHVALRSQGRALIIHEKVVSEEEAMLNALRTQAENFLASTFGLLRSLGVSPGP